METYEIDFGVVGPAAYAKQNQNWIHDARGIARFQGWDYQLKNEPGLLLVYEAKHKRPATTLADDLEYDAIGHYGGAVGNIAVYANVGGEMRIGWRIPDDFGTSPIRPAGDNNAPGPENAPRGGRRPGLHAFVSVDARAVAHDIFLDGNTFVAGPHVTRRPFVADVALGAALTLGGAKLTYAHYIRSREFTTQSGVQTFGSITLSWEFNEGR